MPDQKSCYGKVIPKPLNARLSVRKKMCQLYLGSMVVSVIVFILLPASERHVGLI